MVEVEHTPKVIVIGLLILTILLLGMVLAKFLNEANTEIKSDILTKDLFIIKSIVSGIVVSGTIVVMVCAYRTVRGE